MIVVRARNRIVLVIFNEDIDDITRIVKWLENSGALIDVVSETVKQEIKGHEGKFSTLATKAPLKASMVENTLRKGKKRCWKKYKKVWVGKVVVTAGKGLARSGK